MIRLNSLNCFCISGVHTEWVGCNCERWFHKACARKLVKQIRASFSCKSVKMRCIGEVPATKRKRRPSSGQPKSTAPATVPKPLGLPKPLGQPRPTAGGNKLPIAGYMTVPETQGGMPKFHRLGETTVQPHQQVFRSAVSQHPI